MKLKSDKEGYKRDSKGRFAKGNIPLLKGKRMPLSWRLKDSIGKKKFYIKHPGMGEKISIEKKRYFAVKENRERARRTRNEFLKKNPHFKALARENALRFYNEHPSVAVRNAAAGKEYWKIRKRRKEKSKEMKRFWKNPEVRRRQSKIKKDYYKKYPAAKILLSKNTAKFFSIALNRKLLTRKMKERYRNHPYLRKKASIEKQIYYENNPLALKRLLEYSKKSVKRHIRAKQGFLVRSAGEKKIADFLFEKKINAKYEGIELNLPEMDPVPDFYIPSFNIFAEFYGGYPLAWKTKVEKNKLYRKYKIPVLGITPAELENLDYYLFKQGKQLGKSKIAREFDVNKWLKWGKN